MTLQVGYDTYLNRYAAGRTILKIKGNNSKFGALQTPATNPFNHLQGSDSSNKLPISPNKKIADLGARQNRLEHHLDYLPIRFSIR